MLSKKGVLSVMAMAAIILASAWLNFLMRVPAMAADGETFLAVWNNFITSLEKKNFDEVKKLVASDIDPEFLKSLGEQINSKSQDGVDTLKKMKFVKIHRTADNVVKLGFTLEKPGSANGECLWVVLKNEKKEFKIYSFEPTQSLKFYMAEFSLHIPEGQNFKKAARDVVEVLKNRLKRMEFTNYNFVINDSEKNISLEISGIETPDAFKSFIVKTGAFSLNRCYNENDPEVKKNRDGIQELYEYPYVSKKEPRKFYVAKEPFIVNSGTAVKDTKLTYSGLHVPQVQIDLDNAAKASIERVTENLSEDAGKTMEVACVLDYKVLSTFVAANKITSGRVWVENITFYQTASMLAALIGAGPLPCGIEMTAFTEK